VWACRVYLDLPVPVSYRPYPLPIMFARSAPHCFFPPLLSTPPLYTPSRVTPRFTAPFVLVLPPVRPSSRPPSSFRPRRVPPRDPCPLPPFFSYSLPFSALVPLLAWALLLYSPGPLPCRRRLCFPRPSPSPCLPLPCLFRSGFLPLPPTPRRSIHPDGPRFYSGPLPALYLVRCCSFFPRLLPTSPRFPETPTPLSTSCSLACVLLAWLSSGYTLSVWPSPQPFVLCCSSRLTRCSAPLAIRPRYTLPPPFPPHHLFPLSPSVGLFVIIGLRLLICIRPVGSIPVFKPARRQPWFASTPAPACLLFRLPSSVCPESLLLRFSFRLFLRCGRLCPHPWPGFVAPKALLPRSPCT